ncbi:MAG: biotin transporter BioY [Ignavibacteriaceae bacterium]|nr:biotin transporter BioY [Ignavibacteriaceae bacterium]
MQNIKDFALSLPLRNILANTWFQVISFAALTAVSAQIAFPAKPVPFTFQTAVVVLAGAMLGAKKGAYSQMTYLLLGVAGLPVFAPVPDAVPGFLRLFGPTGGYLLAFPLGALITGLIVEKHGSYFAVVSAMFLGNIAILVSGALYLDLVFVHDLKNSLLLGGAVFSLWTVVKVFTASAIYFSLRKIK